MRAFLEFYLLTVIFASFLPNDAYCLKILFCRVHPSPQCFSFSLNLSEKTLAHLTTAIKMSMSLKRMALRILSTLADPAPPFAPLTAVSSIRHSAAAEPLGETGGKSESDLGSVLSRNKLVKLVEVKEQHLETTEQEEFEQMNHNVLRCLVEMKNVKNCTLLVLENSKQFAIQNFAKSFLDVVDNLGTASDAKGTFSKIDVYDAGSVQQLKTLLGGVEFTETQLMEVFKKKYNPTEEHFDPNRHSAVSSLAGYMLHRVNKPADIYFRQSAVRNYSSSNSYPTNCLWCKDQLTSTSACRVNFCSKLPPYKTLFCAMLVYKQENRVPCHECQKKDKGSNIRYFPSPDAIKQHYGIAHKEYLTWPYPCTKGCGARFRTEIDLNAHMLFCPCEKGDTYSNREDRFADDRQKAEKVLYRLKILGFNARSGPNKP